MKASPFWKRKTLNEMTPTEWESLCDGCGICCLVKKEEERSGRIKLISVSCEHLDIPSCRCTAYDLRTEVNPHCIRLSPGNVKEIPWLPGTCAYRRLAEGRELLWWHPLVSGDPEMVHEAGISVRNRAVSGKYVHPDDI